MGKKGGLSWGPLSIHGQGGEEVGGRPESGGAGGGGGGGWKTEGEGLWEEGQVVADTAVRSVHPVGDEQSCTGLGVIGEAPF